MYKCVLFDMDGTLVDSFTGIYHAYRWTLDKMGKAFHGETFVRSAIGASLPWVFGQLCGMAPDEIREAIAIYRTYYAEKGRYEAKVYDGMEDTLIRLRDAGCFLGTATLKKESFAKEMLKDLGLSPYFDLVCGMDADDRLTKSDLIRRGMQYAGAAGSETVLVGDSEFDAIGAREAGVDFLAVTYGFGFRSREDLKETNSAMIADSASEIADRIIASAV